jgi:hypothetical protein
MTQHTIEEVSTVDSPHLAGLNHWLEAGLAQQLQQFGQVLAKGMSKGAPSKPERLN